MVSKDFLAKYCFLFGLRVFFRQNDLSCHFRSIKKVALCEKNSRLNGANGKNLSSKLDKSLEASVSLRVQ